MYLDENRPDIIIVTGCNAVGKTTASNFLRNFALLHNISYENRIIADSQCLFEAMQLDDQTGGIHHTHDWCTTNSKSHSHRNDQDQPVFPFTVTSNFLPEKMRYDFFQKLSALPPNGKIWFVEWAGGVNINPRNDPGANIDYSYASVKRMLQKGEIPNDWLYRIRAIIHVKAKRSVRFSLNKIRSVPSSAQPEAIEAGTAFWKKDDRVLRFYGRDDFSKLKYVFRKAGIPVHNVKNDGGRYFFESLEKKVEVIFSIETKIIPQPIHLLPVREFLTKSLNIVFSFMSITLKPIHYLLSAIPVSISNADALSSNNDSVDTFQTLPESMCSIEDETNVISSHLS
jgi:hypothetical protein